MGKNHLAAKYVAFGHEIYGNRLKFIEICRDIPREIDRDLIEIEGKKSGIAYFGKPRTTPLPRPFKERAGGFSVV